MARKYLSPQDLDTAVANGVNRETAKTRYYRLHWSKFESITRPANSGLWTQYKEMCEANGVTRSAFYQRIRNKNLNMSPEEAATVPLMNRMENLVPGSNKRNLSKYEDTLTDHDYKRAAKRGISKEQADNRFYHKYWSKERSVTQYPRKGLWNQYKDRCEEIGLGQQGFYKRIAKGMTPEFAVSFPGRGRRKKDEQNTHCVTG